MKKILVLSAVIVLGFISAQAQTATKKELSTPVPTSTNQVSTAAVINNTESSELKKEAKKECSAEEKKACTTKSGKKSCCSSSKTEAKKD